MYNTQDIAMRIKAMTKTKRVTQKEMLSKCEININAITDFAKGKQLSCISLAKIADYLDCSVDYLLGRTDDPNITNSISNTNTTVNGTQANVINTQQSFSERNDEMSSELLKAFQSLPFRERIDILNDVLNRADK